MPGIVCCVDPKFPTSRTSMQGSPPLMESHQLSISPSNQPSCHISPFIYSNQQAHMKFLMCAGHCPALQGNRNMRCYPCPPESQPLGSGRDEQMNQCIGAQSGQVSGCEGGCEGPRPCAWLHPRRWDKASGGCPCGWEERVGICQKVGQGKSPNNLKPCGLCKIWGLDVILRFVLFGA